METKIHSEMTLIFEGKRALVTGAGKGIGRAIAKQLAVCGAEVFALSKTMADLDSLKEEVSDMHVINLDLTDWDKTREELTKIGPLDLLVNNAGILVNSPFLETSKDDLDRLHDVNFKAAYNVAQVVANGMVKKGDGGAIVNMSSISSRNASKGSSVYCSTKAALDMLTKCMALELGPNNIRVNAVNPTVVWTPMTASHKDDIKQYGWIEKTPLGHFAEIEDVVNTVMFLFSDKNAMITGECIRIDGGLGVN